MMEADAPSWAGRHAPRGGAQGGGGCGEGPEGELDDEREADEAADEAEVLALAAQSNISLASNGFELRVGHRVLGAREFARYYRQRHRPADRREVVLVAENARERGMVLHHRANAPAGLKAVTKQQALDERHARRSAAWVRMKTEIATNGPMFRCVAAGLRPRVDGFLTVRWPPHTGGIASSRSRAPTRGRLA